MIISADIHIPFPRSLVYTTYRDKLLQLSPYMPNVQQVEIKSCHKENGLIHFVNEWHGGGEIPLAARAFLSENLLSWTEYAVWNESEFSTKWRTETHAFTEAVHCDGKNRFLENGNNTIIENRGELAINVEQIKGIPHLLKGQIAHIIEEILSKRIESNLLQMGQGVRHYLEAQ